MVGAVGGKPLARLYLCAPVVSSDAAAAACSYAWLRLVLRLWSTSACAAPGLDSMATHADFPMLITGAQTAQRQISVALDLVTWNSAYADVSVMIRCWQDSYFLAAPQSHASHTTNTTHGSHCSSHSDIMSRAYVALAFVVCTAVAVYAAPAADEVTSLPGWDGPLSSKQYSG